MKQPGKPPAEKASADPPGGGGPGRPAGGRAVAVAIHHDRQDGGAPKVVASGRGFVAEQILELAFAHGIKVRQDADLAQILAVLDLDSDIPAEAFAAVAEILVYVYRANATAPAVDPGGPLTPPLAGQNVPPSGHSPPLPLLPGKT
ncbi:EscU/YscU/HrcU family type III secretion system export apparatus switch protein [Novispirillum itersonii]|uniref:EscU/YscU/HrcU family type III secretion system export apparatus switch protein n=1 Tax=Novispirillum itersonii TaxID=189 RepID=UPI00037A2C3B|nr:EscU/YscU/HrcU family type III secretion system export apparatus switch protein [Novispirillum itersonii]